jgi:nucleoside-diphosphate-sugar epimerase
MKVLVTGTDGYLGCLLAPVLADAGHDVTGLDTGYYRAGWLYHGAHDPPRTLTRDIRKVTADDLRGYEAIIHLAELSNDPVGQLAPNITYEINHLGGVELAKKAKQAKVTRFVYFSSCSVYGASSTRMSDEESPTEPLTAYARCKLLVERDLRPLADDNFSPTFLRNATAYGPSPRMRFDIVVNNLTGVAWTTKEIKMDSDGTPWRPLVHALDICRAAVCAIEAPRAVIHNQTFNVGDNAENYQVRDVASIIAEALPGCQLSFGKSSGDRRDYKVSFDKINSTLPGFKCQRNVHLGVRQLLDVYRRIGMSREVFQSSPHTRLKQIQHLIATDQIDGQFFWRY